MKKFTIKLIFKIISYALILFISLSLLGVIAYKFIDPFITPLMVIRCIEGFTDGNSVGIDKEWRDYDEVSKNVFRACIAAEDARFLRHNGIDWRAVEQAKRYNEIHKGKKMRGASTITMQTAKNVFLWNGRSFLRKGLEVYFSYLIEIVWGKERILEVYVNVIEWGSGIYGVEAASQAYFGKSSSKLTNRQAALLAAVLPNPRKFSAKKPSPYIQKRAGNIQKRMRSIALPKPKK